MSKVQGKGAETAVSAKGTKPAKPVLSNTKSGKPGSPDVGGPEDTLGRSPAEIAREAMMLGNYELALQHFAVAISGEDPEAHAAVPANARTGKITPEPLKAGTKASKADLLDVSLESLPPDYSNVDHTLFRDRGICYLRLKMHVKALEDGTRLVDRTTDGPPKQVMDVPVSEANNAGGSAGPSAAPGSAPQAADKEKEKDKSDDKKAVKDKDKDKEKEKEKEKKDDKKGAAGLSVRDGTKSTRGKSVSQKPDAKGDKDASNAAQDASNPPANDAAPPPPPPPVLDPLLTAFGYWIKAAALYGLRRFDEAVEALKRAVNKAPEDAHWKTCLDDVLHLSKLHRKDSPATEWMHLAVSTSDPPAGRSAHAVAAVGHLMYMFGGYVDASPAPSLSSSLPTRSPSAASLDNQLYELDTLTSNWRKVPCTGEIPPERSGHTLTAIGARLFLFGGETTSREKLGEVYVLDTACMCWNNTRGGTADPVRSSAPSAAAPAALPAPSAAPPSTAPSGPGPATAPAGKDAVALVVAPVAAGAPDLKTINRAAAPSARSFHTCIAFDDKRLLIFGGQSSQRLLNDLAVFDTGLMMWIDDWRLKNPKQGAPSKRAYHAAAVVDAIGGGGRMFVFGGFDGTQRLNDLHVLHLDHMRWEPLLNIVGTIPLPRCWTTFVDAGPRLLMFGGYGDTGFLGDLHEYNCDANTWAEWRPDGEWPSRRYGHVACRIGTRMVVHGGMDASRLRLPDTHILDILPRAVIVEGKGHCVYANGDVYDGEWYNNQRSGHGKCVYRNEDTYQGSWSNDHRTGFGTCRYSNGHLYDGMWVADKRSGQGRCTYADGSVYVGTWDNDACHGTGTLTAPNGDTYSGEWRNNQKHGKGRSMFAGPTGVLRAFNMLNRPAAGSSLQPGARDVHEEHDGDWLNAQRHGFGTALYGNGDRYDGTWAQDKRHGHGKYRYSDGTLYDGAWITHKRNGRGFCSYSNNDEFVGKWVNDVRFGEGSCMYANRDQYKGRWANDMRSGTGTCVYANGDKYEGEWANDKRSGIGTCTYANGDSYSGQWADDKRHGHGDMVYRNNDRYSGFWSRDKRSGRGSFTSFDGETYDGDWLEDEREGMGHCVYADAATYRGIWKANMRYGEGTGTDATGSKYSGTWLDDVPDGHGRCDYANGDVYDGEWRRGLREGYGECQYRDGAVYKGPWKNGCRHGEGGVCRYADGTEYTGAWRDNVRQYVEERSTPGPSRTPSPSPYHASRPLTNAYPADRNPVFSTPVS